MVAGSLTVDAQQATRQANISMSAGRPRVTPHRSPKRTDEEREEPRVIVRALDGGVGEIEGEGQGAEHLLGQVDSQAGSDRGAKGGEGVILLHRAEVAKDDLLELVVGRPRELVLDRADRGEDAAHGVAEFAGADA